MVSVVLGVAFSGASAAGDALWVTEAVHTTTGLRVEDCYSATDEWGRDRESAHAGLVERIRDPDVATAGVDFPFSLPQPVLDAQCGGTWTGFLEWTCSDGGPTDAESFSRACRRTAEVATGTRDLRRETDFRRGALCPYADRTRSLTFHGARNVLGRLAGDAETAVAPMQGHDAETVVCEVYPAATFGWLGGYREGYANADGAKQRRAANLEAVADCSVALGDHRETYLANHDALDSLAAALSAARVGDGARPVPAGTETAGCIYV